MSTIDNDHNFETIIGHDGRRIRVLRDRAVYRVPIFMRDADSLRVTDSSNGRDETAGNRAGFRIIKEASINNERQAAYDAYLDDLTNAWRSKPPV